MIQNRLAVDGAIAVVLPLNTTPTNIFAAGSAATNRVFIPMDPASGSVFLRLVCP